MKYTDDETNIPIEKTNYGPGKTSLYYNNVGLFSDLFLGEKLENIEDYYSDKYAKNICDYWNIDTFNQSKYNKAFQDIFSLWKKLEEDIPKFCSNERQLQNRWIDKVFEYLGWTIELEEKVSKNGITNYPDYGLYRSFSELSKSKKLKNKYKNATAIADAKDWGVNLDGKGKTNKNPSYQIINYLRQTDKNWGVLTDGRFWRIYSLRSDSKYTTYYEVDLIKILSTGDFDRFKYFYNFFRVEAFDVNANLSDRCFLDFVFEDGKLYSQKVEKNLKKRVFKVVGSICEGFLDNKNDKYDLDEVYNFSLYYLFKLFFILNCESKGLLEVNKQDDYYEFSLRKKCQELKGHVENGKNWSTQFSTYNYVRDLFILLKNGDESIGVHGFGSEPFEFESELFFNDFKVSDKYLNQALLDLSCDLDEEEKLQFIDFKLFSPDHIGSLFESLLEYKLKKIKGKVRLEINKSSKKSDGAFYTPDYIVDFIVSKTLSSLVKEKSIDEVLKIKVLDPSIGSGHFLLGVVKYLERSILDIQHSEGISGNQIDLSNIKKEIIHNCIFGYDINPLAVELSKFSLWIYSSQKGDYLEPLSDQFKCKNTLLDNKTNEIYKSNESLIPFEPINLKLDFDNQVNTFDAVVGNPPWGAELSQETIEVLSSRFKHSSYKLIDTFKFFIEKSFDFIPNDSGLVGFIVPSSLLSNIGCRDTRELCLSNGIKEVYDLGDGVFEDACAPSCIFLINKSNKEKCINFYNSRKARSYAELESVEKKKISYKSIYENANYEFLQSSVNKLLKRNWIYPLGKVCDVFDSGIDYSRKKLGDAVFYDSEKPKKKADHKVLRGKNINRFLLNEGTKYLRSNWSEITLDQKKLDKKTRIKVNVKAYTSREKILVRQTADQVIAAFDSNQYFNQKSLLSIHTKDKNVDLYYILGILNSPYITEIYRELVSEEGQAFSQVKKNKLEQLPIPIGINKKIEARIAVISKSLTKINNINSKRHRELYAELSSLVNSLYNNEDELIKAA